MMTKTVAQLRYEAAKRWEEIDTANRKREWGPRCFHWRVEPPQANSVVPTKPRIVSYFKGMV